MKEDISPVQIVPADRLTLATLDLEGLLCFRSSLVSGTDADQPATAGCAVRMKDLVPVVTDPRSGILLALQEQRIVGYAIFGRAGRFSRAEEMGFELKQDALVVAALYVTPELREQDADADLLIAVMSFARENDYEMVQVLCREEPGDGPEPRRELLSASGFAIVAEEGGLTLVETTLEQWDNPQQDEEAGESFSGIFPDSDKSN